MASVLGPFGLRKRLLAAVLGRRRREAGAPTPAAAFSSLTAVPAEIDADDADESSLDLVLANASDEPLEGLTATRGTLSWVTVDPAESVVAIVGSDEIEDNDTDVGNILVTVVDQETGAPMPNVAITAASDRPGNDTVTVEDAVTDANGQAVVTITSDAAGESVVTITVDGIALTDTATFTVSGEAPVGPALVFASIFDNGTGTSDAAVQDDGKWTGRVDVTDRLSVVVAADETLVNGGGTLADAGWPTTNALCGEWGPVGGSRAAGQINVSGEWTFPAIGESVWWRFAFCFDGDDASGGGSDDNTNHSVQTLGLGGAAGSGALPAQFTWGNKGFGGASDGTFRLSARDANDSSAGIFRPPTSGGFLTKGAVYRVEMQVYRSGENTLQLHVRVYSSAGVLILEDADFTRVFPATATLADDPDLTLTADQVSPLEALRVLSLGVIGTGMPDGCKVYYGTVAVSRTDWCGIYVTGEGP